MYLIDTSAWIDFLRGVDADHVAALADLLGGDAIVGTSPVILQEILQGADSQERFARWRSYFLDLQCYISRDPVAAHVAAAALYQRCRRKGKTPRSSNDCLIAQTAIENDLQLLHNDRDFEVIAAVAPDLQLYRKT